MPLIQHESGSAVPIWINGKPHPIQSSQLFEVRSAAQNDRVVHLAHGADSTAAKAAVDSAAKAFPAWRTTKYHYRRDHLLRVAELFEQRVGELVDVQVNETSASREYAGFNVKLACGMLREFAGEVTTALTGHIPPIESSGQGFVYKEPYGVVLIIPPWNSSVILATRGIAAALAAGCTVVVKSSELCPLTHHTIVQIFEEAGLPKGCLNSLQATRENGAAVTEALISHPDIKKIEFIGSASVGRQIGKVAATYLKPILMELGGKGPAIVLKDANLQAAAKLCAFGAFLHHGQICFSTERIIVEEEVSAESTELLKQEVRSNYANGAGSHAVTKRSAEGTKKMLDDAKEQGASFLVGDNSWYDSTQTSLTPTIVTGVNESHRLWDNESFGPSATLYVVKDKQAALKLANASAYGLNATIHTRDIAGALAMSRELEYGQVHINSPTTFDQPSMPVTGTKASGWGSNNGAHGIGEFLYNKSVTFHEADQGAITFGS